jgi:hypothetical protein
MTQIAPRRSGGEGRSWVEDTHDGSQPVLSIHGVTDGNVRARMRTWRTTGAAPRCGGPSPSRRARPVHEDAWRFRTMIPIGHRTRGSGLRSSCLLCERLISLEPLLLHLGSRVLRVFGQLHQSAAQLAQGCQTLLILGCEDGLRLGHGDRRIRLEMELAQCIQTKQRALVA